MPNSLCCWCKVYSCFLRLQVYLYLSVSLHDKPFATTFRSKLLHLVPCWIFWHNCADCPPKITVNIMRSTKPTIWSIMTSDSQISLLLIYNQPFLSHMPFWDNAWRDNIQILQLLLRPTPELHSILLSS